MENRNQETDGSLNILSTIPSVLAAGESQSDQVNASSSLPNGGEAVAPNPVIVTDEIIDAIKEFVNDLSTVTEDQDFLNYLNISKHIDASKKSSATKLINGFITFFNVNKEFLKTDQFNKLDEPCISFVSDALVVSFNFQKIFYSASDAEQNVIKDHLNIIWSILTKDADDIYIDDFITTMQAKLENVNMFTFLKKLVQRYKSKILKDPNVPAYIPHILNTLENIDESNLLNILMSFGGVLGQPVQLGNIFSKMNLNSPLGRQESEQDSSDTLSEAE